MVNLLRAARASLLAGISIRWRVVLWVVLLLAVVGAAGYAGFRKLHERITLDANQAAEREMQSVQDSLELHRRLYLEHVRASIELLKRDTLELGPPHVNGVTKINSTTVPNLMFGQTSMINDTQIIDSVQSLMGGKTAIFVRNGDTFIRIATNVLTRKGTRAVNTVIDPGGQAVIALRQGKVYSGILNILGSSYIGEDDPIFDAQGEVIGAWFVGFKIETLGELVDRIKSTRILENGFVVLFDTDHDIVAVSDNAQPEIVRTLCAEADLSDEMNVTIHTGDWSVRKETFVPWDYGIISATYIPDLIWRAVNGIWLIFSVVGVIALGALLAQGVALVRAQQSKEEAEKARQSAEEASRTKSAFLANMSHELRTPLNAIIGYSEMLIEEALEQGQEAMEPDLRKIQTSGKHLLALINDILDLSKIEAGKMTLYFEEFNVPQMIGEIAATIQPLMVKNGNRLEIDCPAEIGVMFSDVTKVRQILFNLLSNASKFTKDGKVRLKCARDAKMVHFSVQDTGVGMPPEAQKKLFKEFSQADDSTTRKYGGTGLGLAISKRFCEMLGGSIRVESQSGVGTTFFVDLPVKATVTESSGVEVQRANVPEPPAESPTQSASSATEIQADPGVLVVDDDPEVQDLLRRILEKEGYRVFMAKNGPQALELAATVRPCLITLDIMMPGIDGWAVLAELKQRPQTRDIPVVVVTLVDNKPMALALGAADYLAKPFDREKILQLLRAHGPAATPRILVIEDDITTYEVLVRVLEKDGFKVSYAPNGRVALEMVAEVKPTLIILDLVMPEMNGFDFITELRRRESGEKIPVIVLSGRELTSPERELLSRTAQKTILKGAQSMHDLVVEVRRCLPARSAKD